MTTYTNVFGGDTVAPSEYAYSSVSLTADTTFYWPELAQGANLVSSIMDVTASGAYSLTLPSAAQVSVGKDLLIRNVGANTFTLKDAAGGVVGTVAAGAVRYLYLTANTTAAGVWAIFTFGTGTSSADASSLAGAGMKASGSTLVQDSPTVTKSASYSVVSADRAQTVLFNSSGTVTCSLPSASSVGNGFFFALSNQGTGTVTLDGYSTETIDGAVTKDIAPGESLFVICNSLGWISVGHGRSTQFQFTKLVLDISSGSPFTLSSVQAQNKLLQTIGTITASVIINVPAVVAVYYVQCSHTGAYSTTIKTAAGTGVALNAGDRTILYCDGVNVVAAQTASAPAANLSGGAAGQVVYQSATGVTGYTAAGNVNQLLASAGTSSPTWTDLGLVTDAYSSKATPVDADELPMSDSAATFGPKKLTWANLKATLKTYLDTLYTYGQSSSVDGEVALFSGTGGKTIKRATTTGMLKATSGVLAGAAAGTDYQAPIGTISGVVKGNGANALTAATAGTDYVAPGTATTFTATQTPFRATATATAGSTYAWTLTAGQVLELTFGAGNITTLSFSGGVAGTFYTLYLKQDGTGGRTVGAWTSFKFPYGVTPSLSSGASAVDIFTFYFDGTSMNCIGQASGVA